MSFIAEYVRVTEEYFFAQVAMTYPGTKIYTPNIPWVDVKNQHWFGLHILTGDSDPASIGKDFIERTTHVVHIDCYGPKESGQRECLRRAEWAARLFAYKPFQIGPQHLIRYRSPVIKSSREVESGMFRAIATIDGWRDAPIVRPIP